MKEKKCIALITRFLVSSLVLASTAFWPIGISKLEAATQNGGTFDGGSDIIQGDVNNDGSVNSIDFAHMRMALLGVKGSVLTQDKFLIADLNMDREFDSIDLGMMRGYLLGKISRFSGAPEDTSSTKTAVPNKTAVPAATPMAPKPVPSPTKSSDDFSNSIAKASYIVRVGEEVNGKIDFEGDKDYLIFEPAVDGKYKVDVFTNLDSTIGYLYVEKVEGLNYYYSSFKTFVSDGSCYIEQDLSAGTKYYLGIKNKTGAVSLDSYTIKITH